MFLTIGNSYPKNPYVNSPYANKLNFGMQTKPIEAIIPKAKPEGIIMAALGNPFLAENGPFKLRKVYDAMIGESTVGKGNGQTQIAIISQCKNALLEKYPCLKFVVEDFHAKNPQNTEVWLEDQLRSFKSDEEIDVPRIQLVIGGSSKGSQGIGGIFA